ncbi:hypothetical protein R1sor_000762 [Riccia sorocarpa]|uniref:Mediator of RNA polymerase II transcription subunit 21 n=1 Tax=Riccia sorocarpa TaxID=122646 RepID=A0ABD3GU12_9MARC
MVTFDEFGATLSEEAGANLPFLLAHITNSIRATSAGRDASAYTCTMDSSRSNPLVNIRGVKRKIEEAVTMLSDFEKDDQKDVAFAALCEDGMECLQKRVADFETDLEETENELLEAPTREKLARTEDRCREVLNQNRVAYDALLAELGRSPSAPSRWDLLLE